MAVQRHEEMEQHKGHAPACPRNSFLGALPCTCMGGESEPNLVHFKAHPMGFQRGGGGGGGLSIGPRET